MTRQRNDLTRFEEQQQIERARALGPELAECLRATVEYAEHAKPEWRNEPVLQKARALLKSLGE